MILGWQGFSFEHPDEWALSRVSGNREKGFLALSSSGAIRCQCRWEKSGSPEKAVERYLASLKKQGPSQVQTSSGFLTWKRPGARGIAANLSDERLVLIEVMGDSQLPTLRRIADSLRSGDLWSAFGLAVLIPAPLDLVKAEFLSAHTTLTFKGKGSQVVAERFGLAEQLLGDRTLAEWTELNFPGAQISSDSSDSSGGKRKPSLIPQDVALIHPEPDLNQISVLKGRGRRLEYLPQWDWFARIKNQ